MTPPFGASPYSTIEGQDQFFHQLFVVGQKNLSIDPADFKIGDTLLSNYDDVEYEVRDGIAGSSPLYPDSVSEETVQALLEPNSEVTRTTDTGTERINIVVQAPRGLVDFDSSDGSKIKISVSFEIYITTSGTSFSSTPDKSVTLSGKSTDTIRKSYSFTRTAGQYDVKIVRTTSLHGGDAIEDIYFGVLQSVSSAEPISSAMQTELTRIALRIRATDQLQGVVDQFNLLVQSMVLDYDGSGSGPAAWSLRATSNPASLALYVLRGEQNPDPVSDSRINWESFEYWHDWCAANGMEYNAVLQGHKTVSELLADIASVGRAFIYPLDGEYTVVVDAPRASAVQFFTPRNSSDFSGSKDFEEPPHALKMQFINEDQGYQWDERIVYDDGYDSSNATKFEKIKLKGVTNSDQAWKTGRYHIAVARLRPETYSLKVDIEGLVCTSGDLVRVTHDVPLWGLYAGRIKSIQTDGSGNVTDVILEEPVPMESGKSYAIRVRLEDGTNVYAEVDTTVDGETDTIPLTTASSENIQSDDLIMYGEAATESVEAIVTGVNIDDNLDCELTLKDYSPAIYDADSGTIPPFDSNITAPADSDSKPTVPIIDNVRSGGEVLIENPDGSFSPQIVLTVETSSSKQSLKEFECHYRVSGSDSPYEIKKTDVDITNIKLNPVTSGTEYEIKLRVNSTTGQSSDWTSTTHTVVGKEGAPSQVPSVSVAIRTGGIEIQWSAVADLDVNHYEVRVGSDWASGTVIFSGDALSYLWSVQLIGTYDIRVKAKDTTGHYSASEALYSLEIVAPGKVQNLGGRVTDNTLRIYWDEPATGSLKIAEYKVYKGDTFSSATLIGQLSATWYTISEDSFKNITYFIVAVDTAGNEGPEEYVTIDDIKALIVSDSTGTPTVGSRRASYSAAGPVLEEWNGTEWIERLSVDVSKGVKTHTVRGNNQLLIYSGAYKDVLEAGYTTGRPVPSGGSAFAFEQSTVDLTGTDQWTAKSGLAYTTVCRYGEHALTGDGSAGARLERRNWLTLGNSWTVEWWLRMASQSVTEWEIIAETMAGDNGVRLGLLRLERIYAEDTYCDDYYERTTTDYSGTMQLSMYSTKWQHEELPINTFAWTFIGLSFDGSSLYIVYDDQTYNLGNGFPNISANVRFNFSNVLGTIIDMLMVLPGTALSTSTLQDHSVDETGYGSIGTPNKMVIYPKSGLLVGNDVEVAGGISFRGSHTYNTQDISGSSSFILPKGIVYYARSNSCQLEIYIDGAWRGVGSESRGGPIFSDGANYRITDTSGNTDSLHYVLLT